jgi:hypothetical protein
MERTLRTGLLVCFVFGCALPHHIITAFYVITLVATIYRTGEPVMGFPKKLSRMQGFLNRNQRDIVVKAQRGDVEEHFVTSA